jgi:hypothetical protein
VVKLVFSYAIYRQRLSTRHQYQLFLCSSARTY